MENVNVKKEIDVDKVKQILEKNKSWKFESCPFCGESKLIRVNYIDFEHLAGYGPCSVIRRIWATCDYCGAESGKRTENVVSDVETVATAICSWNKRGK